jgi:hypothetical protein
MNTTKTETAPRRIKFTKYGMAEDPTRLQVKLAWGNASGFLLGDVVGYRLVNAAHGGQSIVLDVRHFNGEAWPVSPLANVVEVLG